MTIEPIREAAAPVEIMRTEAARSSLMSWAEDAHAAAQIAHQLTGTAFIPESLIVRDTSGNVDYDRTASTALGVILAGTELGLSPMAALRSVDVIKGTPAMRAMAMRAIVQSAGHELVVTESTETRAIVKGRRRGSSEWQTSTWTIDRAQKLGLAGKPNWRQQSTSMLIARATSECARLIAADALLGLPYSAEELADDLAGIEPDQTPPAEQPKRRTAQRKTTTPRKATPPAPTGPPQAERPEPELEPPDQTDEPNKDQLAALHASLRDLGITERDAGLAYIGAAVDREISSSKDLTRDECGRVIDRIKQDLLAAHANQQE